MFENLQLLQKQYEEIKERMERPEVYSDASAYSSYDKEIREIEPVIIAYRNYLKAESDMAAARELFDDPELKELAREDFRRAEEEFARLEDEIKILLLPRDPNDSKNVIMEIRSGVGGEESALFASDLFRMYSASVVWEM